MKHNFIGIVATYNNIAPNGVQYISVDVFRTKPINNNTVIAGINIRPTARPRGGAGCYQLLVVSNKHQFSKVEIYKSGYDE